MLPSDSNIGHPTCNIVVQKEEEEEKVCGEPASQMITLVDPDEQSQVLAVVLVCDLHDQSLEKGKALIAVSESGQDRIAIQYKIYEGDKNDDATKTNDESVRAAA